jgi:hypothetical protein
MLTPLRKPQKSLLGRSLRRFAVFDKKNWFRAVPCGPHIDFTSSLAGSRFLSALRIPLWANLVMGVQVGKLRASDPRVYPFYYRTILS